MNSVVHFELPADDMERARTFYRETFGWKVTPMPDMNDYTVVETVPSGPDGTPQGSGINGGITTRQDPVSAPLIVMSVEDIDQSLSSVEQHGGKTVMPRQAVGDMGFLAYFNDPEGNLIGIWQDS